VKASEFLPFGRTLRAKLEQLIEEEGNPNPLGVQSIPTSSRNEPHGVARVDADVARVTKELTQERKRDLTATEEQELFWLIAEILTYGALVPTNFEPIHSIEDRHMILMRGSHGLLLDPDPEFLEFYKNIEDTQEFWGSSVPYAGFTRRARQLYQPEHPFALISVYGREKTVLSTARKLVAKQEPTVTESIALLANYASAEVSDREGYFGLFEQQRDQFRSVVKDIIALTYITKPFTPDQLNNPSHGLTPEAIVRLQSLDSEFVPETENTNKFRLHIAKKDSSKINEALKLLQSIHLTNLPIFLDAILQHTTESAQHAVLANKIVPLEHILAQPSSTQDRPELFDSAYLDFLNACDTETLAKALRDPTLQSVLLPVEFNFYARMYYFKKAGYTIERITDNYFAPKAPLKNAKSEALDLEFGLMGFSVKYTNQYTDKTSEIQIRDSLSWINANHPFGRANHDAYKNTARESIQSQIARILVGVEERLRRSNTSARELFLQTKIVPGTNVIKLPK
jgi:hypothetical protein